MQHAGAMVSGSHGVNPLFPTPALIRSLKPSDQHLTAVPKAHQRGSGISKADAKPSDRTTGLLDMIRLSHIQD